MTTVVFCFLIFSSVFLSSYLSSRLNGEHFCFVYVEMSVQIYVPQVLISFPHSLPVSAGIVLYKSSRPLYSASFRFYHSHINLSVKTVQPMHLKMCCSIQQESLNLSSSYCLSHSFLFLFHVGLCPDLRSCG
jgi:hypothetical protein